MSMSKKHPTIIKQIQQAIREAAKAGVSRYQISKVSGVDAGTLSRLMRGGIALQTDTAEKILRVVGKRLAVVEIS